MNFFNRPSRRDLSDELAKVKKTRDTFEDYCAKLRAENAGLYHVRNSQSAAIVEISKDRDELAAHRDDLVKTVLEISDARDFIRERHRQVVLERDKLQKSFDDMTQDRDTLLKQRNQATEDARVANGRIKRRQVLLHRERGSIRAALYKLRMSIVIDPIDPIDPDAEPGA